MGCDIHWYVEIREDKDSAWQFYDERGHAPEWDEDDPDTSHAEWEKHYRACPAYIYSGRNYNAFAVLANVRNGVGFAGVDTGDPVVPISLPKGLPEDVSAAVLHDSNEWGVDGHSHSWLSIPELLDYDYDQGKISRGIVGLLQYSIYKQSGAPDSWSGGMSGPNVRRYTNQEMDKLLEQFPDAAKPPEDYDPRRYHSAPRVEIEWEMVTPITRIEWRTPLSQYLGEFYTDVLPAMKELAKTFGTDNVRAVFWFDN